jgi:hypothetical protein
MRLSRVAVAEREAFLYQTFLSNPDWTAKQANEALQKTYGKFMRLGRVYTIQREAKERGAAITAVAKDNV